MRSTARLLRTPTRRVGHRPLVVVAAISVLVSACGVTTPAPSPSWSATAASAGTPSSTVGATALPTADPTAAYLAQLDIPALLDRAATYGSPVAPSGDPSAFVASLQAQYRGVDRVAVLREVFARLTAGAATETDKERAVLGFVQHLSVHDFASPFIAMPIFDPLILFQTFAMDCQKDSRLIADLYAAAGYDSPDRRHVRPRRRRGALRGRLALRGRRHVRGRSGRDHARRPHPVTCRAVPPARDSSTGSRSTWRTKSSRPTRDPPASTGRRCSGPTRRTRTSARRTSPATRATRST